MLRTSTKILLALAVVLLHATVSLARDYEIAFSTYLGGSGGEDTARAVAIDAEGHIFVAGGTMSADFPTTSGAYQRKYASGGRSVGDRGPMDAWVAKLSPDCLLPRPQADPLFHLPWWQWRGPLPR